ncbi:hypothetical protein DFH28DRAFT_504988 [Melampsora americana]|nr:hypothetical protein DFH28DRAFT_504988 [Melampsora americana]
MVISPGFITFVSITILSLSVLGMKPFEKVGFRIFSSDLKDQHVTSFGFKKLVPPIKNLYGKDKNREGSKGPIFDQYSSFYEAARFFKTRQSHKENAIKGLASRVLELVQRNPDSRSLENLLQENSDLTERCRSLAIKALSTPQNLTPFERIWVVGILGGLAKCNEDIKIPKDLSKQVTLEIQAALHYEAQITETFDEWIKNKKIGLHIFGFRLEELLNRAKIIGEHETKRPPNSPSLSIDNLVSQFLMKVELPQDENILSDLISQLHQIFKTMEYQSWEGHYTRVIFEHLSFYSPIFRKLLHVNLKDGGFWRDFHIPLAKNDVIELSKKLKPILENSYMGIGENLYEIMKDPGSNSRYFKGAISNLLGKLKNLSSEDLVNAYKLLMAHSFLSSSAEKTIISEIGRDQNIHSGISRALAVVYPAFVIEKVDVLDYQYILWKKEPQFLLGAKFEKLQFDVSTLKHKEQGLIHPFLPPPTFMYDPPENYMDRLYIRVQNILRNNGEHPDRSFGIGLEMLFILTEMYPEREDYLLKYLDTKVKNNVTFKERVLKAIDYLTEKDQFAWRDQANKLSNDVKDFAIKLKTKIHTQILETDQDGEVKNLVTMDVKEDAKRLSLQPLKNELKMIIGEEEFDFNLKSWDDFLAPKPSQK